MKPRFPYWVPFGALILVAGYFPTLATPFDFIDDGNLVYPAPAETTFAGHVNLWWQKVLANYEHLGPVRPVLWAHWEVFANLSSGDPQIWRVIRFVWCGLAAGMLLWLFREMQIHPVAALVTGAAAMWNPYRNEIWTSLTLGEGVAMPYAILGLIAARKAASSAHPWIWEVVSILGVIAALGCKNTFVAIVPAQILLRMWPEGLSLREGWKRDGWRALALGVTIIMPVAHYIYFKLNWHPGQYQTHGPSFAQLGRVLNGLKGAIGLDFLGAGLAITLAVVVREGKAWPKFHVTGLAALLLVLSGIVVYLPLDMMSGRYTMPAVWGLDLAIGLLFTRLIQLPPSVWKKIAWAGIWVGLLSVTVANMVRQEKFAARANMLWDVVRYLETHAEPNAKIAWISGDSTAGELNVEEGIHVRWHLLHRGRADVQIGLFDREDKPLDRVELPHLKGDPDFVIWGTASFPGWHADQTFRESYQLGRKFYECNVRKQ